ncbi:MAG TPA: PEP-CTERM sorting domain-containing protein [Vicinamibacterales bacterium]|nr:PEP-CTERM sorting domain-containing protein [Vicinamibacterales bacterium]
MSREFASLVKAALLLAHTDRPQRSEVVNMRRVAVALLFAMLATVRFAHAAAISVAGAECGSPPLLGLQIIVPATGSNLGTACPDNSFGSIFGDTGGGETGPLYGSPLLTIDFTVSDLSALANLEILQGSAFDKLVTTPTGFELQGGGILACAPSKDPATDCFPDAVVTFSDFNPGTVLRVTAVNGVAVPEPATTALILSGMTAAFVRRRARRRKVRS